MSTVLVAGVDIGGSKKGCNLVLLRGQQVVLARAKLRPEEVADLCREHGAQVVGVDAPSQWAEQGARLAERDLARAGISCFSTPSRARATQVPFFHWMLNGEAVYQALAPSHPVLGEPAYGGGAVAFETFPHAVTCAFLGRAHTSAREKRTQRRAVLEGQGIETSMLSSMDDLDAAMCALAAAYLLRGAVMSYGDAAGGRIFVPAPPG